METSAAFGVLVALNFSTQLFLVIVLRVGGLTLYLYDYCITIVAILLMKEVLKWKL